MDWRTLFDGLPVGVVVYKATSEDPGDLLLTYANRQASVESGFDLTPFVGKTMRENFPDVLDLPPEANIALYWLRVALTGKQEVIEQYVAKDAHHRDRTFRVTFVPVPDRCSAAVYENVTEVYAASIELKSVLDELEGQLGETSRPREGASPELNESALLHRGAARLRVLMAEKANYEERLHHKRHLEALGRLAGGVAHDINNMLAPMVILSELITDRHRDPDTVEAAEGIIQAAQRAGDIVRQLLDIGRRNTPNREPVDARALADEVASLVRATAPDTVKIRVVSEARNSVVNGDPAQLHRMLSNLLGNGVRAVQGRGTVEVLLANSTPPSASDGRKCLHIQVSDDGSGIPPEVLPHVFEPFFTTQKGQHSGLGLAVVFGIVSSHQGTIEVTSEIDRGTKFDVYLPLSDNAPQTEPAPRIKHTTIAANVLVVDDEIVVAGSLSKALRSEGYKVTVHTDPSEALQFFSEHYRDLDLVILDMIMPQISGLECLERMKAIDPNVRVVVASGYTMQQDGGSVLERGALKLLHKPFQLDQLRQVIADVLATPKR